MPRNYKRERELAIKRGETGVGSKSNDATSHRARRAMEKKLGKKLPSTTEVGHKKPQKSGGTNAMGNLKVQSRSSNRAEGGRIGNAKLKGKPKKS